MTIINYGHFQTYEPLPDDPVRIGPTGLPMPDHVLYYRNEDGLDWYALVQTIGQIELETGSFVSATDGWFAAVRADGTVEAVSHNPYMAFPGENRSFISSDEEIPVGKVFDGTTFNDPPPVSTVPFSITHWQFYQAMAIRGNITEEEALEAAGSGVIPAQMQTLIDQLPVEQQFGAMIKIRGATTYERQHPLASLIGQLYGWDDTALDEFWTFAATL